MNVVPGSTGTQIVEQRINSEVSLRSWRDFVRECFCFGSEAVKANGKAVRGLVKSRVE